MATLSSFLLPSMPMRPRIRMKTMIWAAVANAVSKMWIKKNLNEGGSRSVVSKLETTIRIGTSPDR